MRWKQPSDPGLCIPATLAARNIRTCPSAGRAPWRAQPSLPRATSHPAVVARPVRRRAQNGYGYDYGGGMDPVRLDPMDPLLIRISADHSTQVPAPPGTPAAGLGESPSYLQLLTPSLYHSA